MAAASWTMADARRFAAAQRSSRLGRLLSRRGKITKLPPPLSGWTKSARSSGATAAHVPRVVGGGAPVSAARDEVLRRIAAALGPGPRRVVDVPRAYRQDDDPALAAGRAWSTGSSDRLVDYKATSQPRRLRGRPAGRRRGGRSPSAERPDLVVPAGVPDEWLVGSAT